MSAAILLLLAMHESSVSSSRLEFRDREILATFTFSLEDLAGLARLDRDRNGIVESAEWSRALPDLFDYVGKKFRIESGGAPCRSEGLRGPLPPLPLGEGRAPVTLQLRYVSPGPLGRVSLHCELFNEHGGNPRHVAELPGGRTLVFDRERSRVDGLPGIPTARAGFPVPAALAVAAALLVAAVALRRRVPEAGGR